MIACPICFGTLEAIYGLFTIITGGLAAFTHWRNKRHCKCHGNKEGMSSSSEATSGGGLHM